MQSMSGSQMQIKNRATTVVTGNFGKSAPKPRLQLTLTLQGKIYPIDILEVPPITSKFSFTLQQFLRNGQLWQNCTE